MTQPGTPPPSTSTKRFIHHIDAFIANHLPGGNIPQRPKTYSWRSELLDSYHHTDAHIMDELTSYRNLVQLAAGASAGLASRCVTAPLNVIKTSLQVVPEQAFHGVRDGVRELHAAGGVRELFKGNLLACARIVPFFALKFSFYEETKAYLYRHHDLRTTLSFTSGAIAGLGATALTYPLDVLKTRFTVQADSFSGVRDALVRGRESSGVRSFYRGLIPTCVGTMLFEGTQFLTYDKLKVFWGSRSWMEEEQGQELVVHRASELTAYHHALFGGVSGILARLVSFPVDVVRKRMHLQCESVNEPVRYRSAWHCAKDMLSTEGFQAFWKGRHVVRWVAPLSSAVTFAVYEEVKRVLFNLRQD